MEELIEILEELLPGEDVANCTTLIDDHILNSFGILSLVSEIEIGRASCRERVLQVV